MNYDESAERYRAILDTAIDGIVTISENGLIESFNRAAERMFGYSADELVGRNVSLLMPEPYRTQHDSFLANYLRTGNPRVIGFGREVSGLRRDGSIFPMDLSVGEVHLPGRRLFTGILRDISDRKAAENEARRRLNELAHVTRVASMADLASGLAHEVNQPLTAIMGHARACLRRLESVQDPSQPIVDSLRHIVRQTERAAEVTDRIRRFVHKQDPLFQRLNLNELIEDVLELLHHETVEQSVAVSTDLTDGLPAVYIDRVQIEQVVFNLARNAIEAMMHVEANARELRIASSLGEMHDQPMVSLSIQDSGPGFADGQAEQLFEPFYTTKHSGLGQGLSICKSILERHGGCIEAIPKPGSGAVFTCHLPLADHTTP